MPSEICTEHSCIVLLYHYILLLQQKNFLSNLTIIIYVSIVTHNRSTSEFDNSAVSRLPIFKKIYLNYYLLLK